MNPQHEDPKASIQSPGPEAAKCCASGGGCGGLDRREFIKAAGAGLATITAIGGGSGVLGAPLAVLGPRVSHFVPADKRLSPDWVRGLFAKGVRHVWRDKELNTIGMPVGGIAAGQVYLCGDGTLGCWKIFNQPYYSGSGGDNYRPRMPDKPIDQGFAVIVESGPRPPDGDSAKRADQDATSEKDEHPEFDARPLDRRGFPAVEFTGEYPIAAVRYAEPDFPVRVELEAFSPFIPLNDKDSALPATVLRYTLENASDRPVRTALVGWLENAVGFHSIPRYKLEAMRRHRIVHEQGRTLALHTTESMPPEDDPREDIVLADFEGGGYGDWTVEGEAFGEKPAADKMGKQQPVTGYLGEGLVNTYLETDDAQGKLTSPPFVIRRKYLNFLIGGGAHAKETCVNLLIDGKTVRTAAGRNEERLQWESWDVREFEDREARIEIVDQRTSAWGHVNVDQIELSDRRRFDTGRPMEQLDDFGSMTLALGEPGATGKQACAWAAVVQGLDENLHLDGDQAYSASERRSSLLATRLVELAPGQQRTFTFVIAWHFPYRGDHGQMYANWFDGAADVAHYVFANLDRLTSDTRRWHDTYYDSTLPYWLLDRLHSTVSYLATATCQWWQNGRFWAWEGVGCCAGTCTHVWNYAHAAARLFPRLERSVREMQDLGAGFHEDGLVGFRAEDHQALAADGQCGTILKCFREHLMSPDDGFLQRNWLKIRRVLEYCIKQDGDENGLLEGTQHNTYDINFEGPNTFVGSLYLAALRAGEGMAKDVGETDFAQYLQRILESGSRLTVERLWDGEYFIQEVDLDKHPKHQYARGCLSDQLFGQGWAHQLALGYLYPQDLLRQALAAIWKYNWAPDIGPQNAFHPPGRWFAYPGEAGLFVCTWPKSEYLKEGVEYREEVWTGIEYQVAGHMIWEGMLTEGLAIVRAIQERYHPSRRNPFNEVECGDHYARALAGWGVYLALCGFEYHGPKGVLGFAPRITPEDFRAAFTTAEGWGTFSQRWEDGKQVDRIEVRWGTLRLTTLVFSTPMTIAGKDVLVQAGGRRIPAEATPDGERLTILLEEEMVLREGDVLEIAIG